ncbi:hypothetical protein HMPREF9439_00752 [Parasutterella excrementihominis YIT 11859]|uniref:Uncharacterized protein n=1 Tax=Parasutterella excrementihominis YIT 11859 TaxID=762966 RepID=F3QIK3_9BURK|nr:hypothetical protein HMPREF9439_00752 [Parasutterella excrementihominis YIT 11859]
MHEVSKKEVRLPFQHSTRLPYMQSYRIPSFQKHSDEIKETFLFSRVL